jgi:lipid A ethanolaminephosphotransferase
MLFWGSASLLERLGVNERCLMDHRDEVLSHAHLFHSVLGLLDVETAARRPELDLFSHCRSA